MKKIYEKPMVELTKFDVEDIILASGGGIDAATIDVHDTAAVDAATTAISGTNKYDKVGVYNW